MSKKKIADNIFENLWMDAHPSLAPKNTLSYVLNGTKQTDQHNNFGYTNDKSNTLCASIPEGYKMRGYTQIPERDEFIIFSYNGFNSEIGGLNTKTCTYKTYLNDTEIECKLNFGFNEWITIEAKRIQPCNEVVLYWSNNRIYRYLNIDQKDVEKTNFSCDKLRLFKCNCAPKAELHTIKNGGYGLRNGIYQVAVRFTDEDNNVTNWFHVSKHTKVFGGDNRAGEPSNQYINIQLDGLSENYNFVDVAIIKTIAGQLSVNLIYDKQPYNSNGISLDYRGDVDDLEDMTIQEILKKEDYWINGKGLVQKDNRLILFDVDNHWNLNYQKTANEIKVGWALRRVRVEDAYKYPSLMGSENYMFGIRWNYCDGTSSVDFPLLNRPKSGSDSAIIEGACSDCGREAWEVLDTSIIESTHSSYGDPYQESAASEKVYTNHVPTKEPYKTIDEWAQEHKDEAKKDIDEVNKIAKENLEDEDDLIDSIAGGDCCDGDTVTATENSGEPEPVDACTGVVCPPGCECFEGACFKVGLTPRSDGDPATPGEPCIAGNGNGNAGSMNVAYTGSNNRSGGGDSLTLRTGEDNPRCQGNPCFFVLGKDFLCPKECQCVPNPAYVYCDGNRCDSTFPCPPGCECVGEGTRTVCKQSDPQSEYICIPKPNEPEDPGSGNNDHDSNVPCQPVYDEDGCTQIDCIPMVIMTGQFGYAESKETYPTIIGCDGELLYGDVAGEKIRLFKAPSREKIPHFISYQTGVKNIQEPGNDELDRGYVQILGLNITNIKAPTNTPKPLCGTNPFTITYIKRDDSNKTVLAKGLFMGTFEGKMYGDTTLFPNNGVNSLELFNRHINSNTNKVHAGYLSEVPGYTFHSPTTSFSQPFIGGNRVVIDQEVYGKGWKHGQYCIGDEPGTPELAKIGDIKTILTKGGGLNIPRLNQKGYRGAIHLNKYKVPEKDGDTQLRRCLTDISYVGADKVLPKGPNFTKTFHNKDSESCVFLQLDKFMYLGKSVDPYLSDNSYNGEGGNLQANRTRDASFLGNVKFFEGPIYLASAHYGGIYIDNKRQYGRLEKAPFISTGIEGTWQDIANESITGICGDVYISPYSFTKSTYISNLVGDDVMIKDPLTFQDASAAAQGAPETGGGKNGGKAQGGAKGIKKVIANLTGSALAWAISLCANIPVAGLTIKVDPRNGAGLRGFDNDPIDSAFIGGGYWDGSTSFLGNANKNKKVYYPGLQKTEIIYWVESEVAVPLRITGHEEDKEINYLNTKSYDTDSSFTGNVGWRTKYLNMFYMLFPELSLYQKLLITFIIIGVKIIFPLYILLQLGGYVHGGGGIAGALLSIIIQIVLLLITIVFVILLYIALKTFASEYLIQFLGLKQCYNDLQGGPGDGFKRDFHDNFYQYNWDYSKVNEFTLGFAMPINYNTCLCVAEPSNKIIYSNPQLIGAPNDAWRNFKVNNVLDVTSKYGKITTMIVRGERLYAGCTDMILDLRTGQSQLQVGPDNIELGRGDYINAAIPIADGVLEGYAGIKYPNGSINTVYGYIFIDEEAGRIYSFNGQAPEEISNFGVREFMKKNLKLEYLKDRPDFPFVDQKTDNGIGYAIGYDYEQERILITKRDFKPSSTGLVTFNGEPCIDKSWTLSYDPMTKKWVSFHSFTPHLYMFDRYSIYSPKDSEIWQFNTGKDYQTYYGKYHPFIMEYSSPIEGMSAVKHDYTELDVEGNFFNDKARVMVNDSDHDTFNKAVFYNTKQSTGLLYLVDNVGGTNVRKAHQQINNELKLSKLDGNWRFSSLRDHCIDPKQPLFILDEHDQLQINGANISKTYKHMYMQDKYIISRFILDNNPDLQLICKRSVSIFDYPSL